MILRKRGQGYEALLFVSTLFLGLKIFIDIKRIKLISINHESRKIWFLKLIRQKHEDISEYDLVT